MHCLLNLILLLWISLFKLTVGLTDIQSIYDDLRGRNESCSLDTCSYNLKELDTFERYYRCHCDENCARFGTCCLDSPYIQTASPKLKSTCRHTHRRKFYFMVDRCPTSDSIWEGLCRERIWDNENDFLKIVPVTSLLTSVTYKNYFCFRCHETNDEFIFWKVKFESFLYGGEVESISSEEMQSDFEKQRFSMTYKNGHWYASFKNGSVSFYASQSIEVPPEIRSLATLCSYVIRDCADGWTDSETREKCQAYQGIREVKGGYGQIYKNMHCALCNFEDLNEITCATPTDIEDRDPSGKMFFSFSHLLDINNADGDKVGKIQKCDDDHIWDRFAERCRKLTCAFPGYKIKNGKCQS